MQVISSTGSLVLPNISEKDEGTYSCSASNYITGHTITSHQKIFLRVSQSTDPQQPRFPYRPEENYTVPAGKFNKNLELIFMTSIASTTIITFSNCYREQCYIGMRRSWISYTKSNVA